MVLEFMLGLNPTTYGYEPPITDASKANEQRTKNVRPQEMRRLENESVEAR
jgi:hypothetical protein